MLKFLLDIIQTPAIVLGLVALIGLTLQRKAFSQIFSGTLKTALGMLVLSAGSSLIVTEILPFVSLLPLQSLFVCFAISSVRICNRIRSSSWSNAERSSGYCIYKLTHYGYWISC